MPVRLCFGYIVIGATLGAAGCQTYEPAPLDVVATREAFLNRVPESPAVAELAARLAQDEAAAGEAPTFDLADGVSLREGEALAMVFNTKLRLARLKAGVALAGAENAGLWEDPSIGIDLRRVIQGVPEPWIVMTTLRLTIPISGRLEVEKKLASAEHAAELVRVAAAEWAVRMEVGRKWAEWSALTRKLEVVRNHHERLEVIVSIIDRMLAAGELARAEARLFQIERAMHLAELRMLESEVRRMEVELRSVLGLAPEAAVALLPTLAAPELAAAAEQRGLFERRSPMLAAARAEYDAAERMLELEVKKQWPDLMIGPGYEREDGMDRFVFGLDVPLPILNANRRGIAEARAKREESRGRFEAAYERGLSELASAGAALEGARVQRAVFEKDVVPLVDLQYEEARKIAELGEVDTLLLLETLSRQQAARLKLIEAVTAEAIAGLRVVELVGPEPSVKLDKQNADGGAR